MDFNTITKNAVEQGVSDMHLVPGFPVFFRKGNTLLPFGSEVVSKDNTNQLILSILNTQQKKQLQEARQVDFLYLAPGGARFRGNAFFNNHGLSICFRIIGNHILGLEALGFPEAIVENLRTEKQGLILIVGSNGQGKSTTMASILADRVNRNSEHIITIEDPIEYLIPSGKGVIQQRQINRDVNSFSSGIEGALRENPDIIMIGEIRDKKSMQAALTLTETGHLVFGTLHTTSAVQTVSRILDSFTSEEKPQIRSQLASCLNTVVSQSLVPSIEEGKRVLAYEILNMNYSISSYIRQDKIFQIPNIIQTDSSGNMVQFEQSLVGLIISGKISKETAIEHSQDKNQIKALLELNNLA